MRSGRGALVFLACFSEQSRTKPKSYMNEELTLAVEKFRKLPPGVTWLIPVRFDDGDIPDWDLGAGRALSDLNFVDLYGQHYLTAAVTLTATINQLMGTRGLDATTLRASIKYADAAQRPTTAGFSLALEPEVLVEGAIGLLRGNDDIPIRRLLNRAVPDLRALFKSGDEEGVAGLLDRLTCLAATFLDLKRHGWFQQVIDTLVAIYGVGFENEAPIVNAPPRRSAVLWLAIIERVVALGGLAVRRGDWPAVRGLVARRHPDMNEMYTTWLRHAMIMANRVELLTTRDGDHEVVDSLLSCARNVARRLEWLRPDVEPDDEKILTSLTQFDFLATLVVMADSDNKSGIFPNFARFRTQRTQPAAQRLLREPAMRKTLYPGDDHQLANALHTIDRDAQRAGFQYDGWDGYTSDVNAFIHEQGAGTDQP